MSVLHENEEATRVFYNITRFCILFAQKGARLRRGAGSRYSQRGCDTIKFQSAPWREEKKEKEKTGGF